MRQSPEPYLPGFGRTLFPPFRFDDYRAACPICLAALYIATYKSVGIPYQFLWVEVGD